MNKEQLLQKIDAFIQENEKNIINDIAELISKRSVNGPAEEGAPFGRGPRNALDAALSVAERLGLSTSDGDGHVGWGELAAGEGHIALIAHLDVVPEGEGWDTDPYIMAEKDGWLIGRGVSDNKGAVVISLYAASFFARAGEPLNYGIRVLLGCDEESCMRDVPHYLSRNPEPLFCFTPDADFPVCNGEKGVYASGVFVSAPVFSNISSFTGGLATNVIPADASCVIRGGAKEFKETEGIRVTPRDDGSYLIEAHGIGGHASIPEGCVNGIGILTNFLLDNGIGSSDERVFLELLRKLHSDVYGTDLGIACSDEILGRLTCIGGMISQEDGVVRQDINIRYPGCVTGEELTRSLSEIAFSCNSRFEEGESMKPFYIPADSPPIQVLLSSYNEISGLEAKTYTMGGGTYARRFRNAVGFGPGDNKPRPPHLRGDHSPNESVSVSSLKEALKIYILSLWRLEQLSLEDFTPPPSLG
ncbi:MAG: Sapep family Mn(2+)-dependent dipeptidase [Synergistaceae bacterium]|nr:Sapep family Mn(2+)-dependent dipeptidase [Synergistaceae bacterium]